MTDKPADLTTDVAADPATLSINEGVLASNGKIPVDPDLSPKAQAHQRRVAENVQRKARGEKGLGTVNEELDRVVDEEILPYLSVKGLGPRDCRCDVSREQPPGPSGHPAKIGYMVLDQCPSGREVVEFIVENFHLARPDKGPARYRVTFRTLHQGTFINDGVLALDSYEDIMAIRGAMARARARTVGTPSPYIPGSYGSPPQAYAPPPYAPPPAPAASPSSPAGAPAGGPVYHSDPHAQAEVAQLRVELANMMGRMNALLGQAQQPPPAPPPPAAPALTPDAITAAVVAGLRAAGIGAPAPPPAPAPPQPDAATQARAAGGTLDTIADVLIGAKRAFGKLEATFGGAQPGAATAEPIPEGEEADDLPFRAIPIPGVKTKDGKEVMWTEDKKTQKFHGMGFIAANSDIFGRFVEKGLDVAEKVIGANTITVKGE